MRTVCIFLLVLASVARAAVWANEPTLLIFGATWCGACTKLHHAIEQHPELLAGYAVVPVDIDTAPKHAQRYAVRQVPTLIIVREDGTVFRRRTGFTDVKTLKRWLERHD
jgi:thioredoxin 2